MADAFAQVTRRPALVNLHSSAGVGNAMGNLVAADHGNTPLIVTSGQQHRELMIREPYLGNREATTMPKPWVKWSYEPYRAEDVPEAFMRAYAMAVQPPPARSSCRYRWMTGTSRCPARPGSGP
jgi:benzoylformate decarboxylase